MEFKLITYWKRKIKNDFNKDGSSKLVLLFPDFYSHRKQTGGVFFFKQKIRMNGVHLRTTSFMLAIKHTCRERKFKLRTCGHPCLKIDQKPENGGEYKLLRRRPHR